MKENSTCILPNSEFKIELVEGADTWFMRQYDIPVELRPIVRRRMKEWWDAGWVQPFGNGKNIYNSAWLAVNKVLGGRIAKDDTRVCIDYHPGNLRTKDPDYFILRAKDLLEKVWGMKVFTELDLVNAYHQRSNLRRSQENIPVFIFWEKGNLFGMCYFLAQRELLLIFKG